jgi:hypothetical protein
MTHMAALRNNTSPVLVIELAEWPNFTRPTLTETSYEPQGDIYGKK